MKKILSSILATVIVANIAFAQHYDFTAVTVAQTYSNYGNGGRSITSDPSGAQYVCGTYSNFTTFGSTTLNAVPSTGNPYNGYLVKYNKTGKLLWAKNILCDTVKTSTSLGVRAKEVVRDDAGNIYVGGDYAGRLIVDGHTMNSVITNTTSYTNNYFVIKFDKNGNFIYMSQYQPNGFTSGMNSMAVDHTGSAILVGSDGYGLGYIWKLNASGGTAWTYRDTYSASVFCDVSIDKNNSIYMSLITGGNELFGTFRLPTTGGNDHYMIVKLDAAGNGAWYYYPTQPSESGFPGGNAVNVLTTKSGVTYVATNENATVGKLVVTDRSSYIFKLSAAGKIVKERILNKSNSGSGSNVYDLAFDKEGNLFAGGTSFGATTTVGDSSVTFPYPYQTEKLYVAKFDDALNFNWCVVARSYETNTARITVADSIVYAAGTIASSAKFGNIEVDNSPYYFYLTKISPVGSGKALLNEDAKQGTPATVSAKFEIYPNPVASNSKIQFSLTEPQNVAIQIISNDGRILSTSNKGKLPAGNYSFPLNANLFSAGVYHVRLITGKNAEEKEFIK